jgi:hypothetical protein
MPEKLLFTPGKGTTVNQQLLVIFIFKSYPFLLKVTLRKRETNFIGIIFGLKQ